MVNLPELMSDYSFVNRTEYTEMSEEVVRKRMLDVMTFLKKICEENGIAYYLGYGTLLGTVRHK